jgi:endonuclease YncB( thermonuclease family)
VQFVAAFLLLALSQSFTAQVVGVHDGDTITVYDGRDQTRIRLEGIDCPESGADFSRRAKEFTSDLVFGKDVRIDGKETDRYGRLVARVKVAGTDVSLALVEAGLAWHYKEYSDDPVLAAAELVARSKKVGVWSLPNPVPPWEYRTLPTDSRGAVGADETGDEAAGGVYHGNRRSKVYHAPGCQHYDCSNCTVELASKDEAASQGFRPHVQCVGAAGTASSPASLAGFSPASTASSGRVYHGNSSSKVYHAPGCQHYYCKNCTVVLKSKEEAAIRGFRPHAGRGGCVR